MKQKLVFVVLLLVSIQTYAWGPVGHRAVGLIADNHLTPQAKAGVAQLLGSAGLGDVANWADQIKSGSQYQQTHSYHFEDIEDGMTYTAKLQSLSMKERQQGGVVAAILLAEDLLRSPKTATADKVTALKFLVHFVGDLHQPLHTGRPGDKGGNTIQVNWFGSPTSLHGVWDTRMITTGHADVFHAAASRSDDGAAYADYLEQQLDPAQVDTSTNIEKWFNESLSMRSGVYDPAYMKNQQKYQDEHLPEIDQRIYSAGLRLAAMVNDLFKGAPYPSADQDLHDRVEKITGPISAMVNFNP